MTPNIAKNPEKKRTNDIKYLCFITLSKNDRVPIKNAIPIRNNSTFMSNCKKIGKVVANRGNTKQCIKQISEVQIPSLSFILLIYSNYLENKTTVIVSPILKLS